MLHSRLGAKLGDIIKSDSIYDNAWRVFMRLPQGDWERGYIKVNILVHIEQILLKTLPMCRSMQDVSNNV